MVFLSGKLDSGYSSSSFFAAATDAVMSARAAVIADEMASALRQCKRSIDRLLRNWDRMANIVLFRVNGKQVQPPWGAEWQKDDVFGVPVKSGCKAWKRYALKRKG